MCMCTQSCLALCNTLDRGAWTVADQAPLSKGFSRQEYWSGLLFHTPGDLPDPRIKSASLASTYIGSLPPALPGKPISSLMPFKSKKHILASYICKLQNNCHFKINTFITSYNYYFFFCRNHIISISFKLNTIQLKIEFRSLKEFLSP